MRPTPPRPWCCYPSGPEPSRRTFLKALATAAAASGLGLAGPAGSQEESESAALAEEPESGFPADGFPPGSIRLNFNENPLGPSPRALAAILGGGLGEAHRYNFIRPLIRHIAEHHGLGERNVLVGCGSTEFLQFAPWAFLRRGGSLVLPSPSYEWSAGVAQIMGAEVRRVPLQAEGRVDTAALERAVDRNTLMLYLANPNNPTGASLTGEELQRLAAAIPQRAVLLADEAYSPFLPSGESAIDLVRAGAPVLVTRTFSKAYGLAGLRLGYAVAPPEIISRLRAVWWGDFGINTAANLAGPAALADEAHLRSYVRLVDEGLAQLRGELTRLGLRCLPHRTPFFLADLGKEARPVVRALRRQRIFIQDGRAWGLPTFVRVSVGLQRENEAFLKALKPLLA